MKFKLLLVGLLLGLVGLVAGGYGAGHLGAKRLAAVLGQAHSKKGLHYEPGRVQSSFGWFSSQAWVEEAHLTAWGQTWSLPRLDAQTQGKDLKLTAPLLQSPLASIQGLTALLALSQDQHPDHFPQAILEAQRLESGPEQASLVLEGLRLETHPAGPAGQGIKAGIAQAQLHQYQAQAKVNLAGLKAEVWRQEQNQRQSWQVRIESQGLSLEGQSPDPIQLGWQETSLSGQLSLETSLSEQALVQAFQEFWNNPQGQSLAPRWFALLERLEQHDLFLHALEHQAEGIFLQSPEVKLKLEQSSLGLTGKLDDQKQLLSQYQGQWQKLEISGEEGGLELAGMTLTSRGQTDWEAFKRYRAASRQDQDLVQELVQLIDSLKNSQGQSQIQAQGLVLRGTQQSSLEISTADLAVEYASQGGNLSFELRPGLVLGKLKQLHPRFERMTSQHLALAGQLKLTQVDLMAWRPLVRGFNRLPASQLVPLVNQALVRFTQAAPSLDLAWHLYTDQKAGLEVKSHLEILPLPQEFNIMPWLISYGVNPNLALSQLGGLALQQTRLSLDLALPQYQKFLGELDQIYQSQSLEFCQSNCLALFEKKGEDLLARLQITPQGVELNGKKKENFLVELILLQSLMKSLPEF